MLAKGFITLLALINNVVSAPAPVSIPGTHAHLINPTSPVPEPISLSALGNRTLHPEEVVVYGRDRAEIWQRSVYLAANADELDHPGHDLSRQNKSSPTIITTLETSHEHKKHQNAKRGCSFVRIVYNNPPKVFLDWDQKISPIAHNPYAQAIVNVGKSYSLAQGVTVTAGADVSIIKDVMKISASVAYSHTWTTTDSATLSYFVPQGLHGVVSSNARTKRYSGTVKEGCVGEYSKEWTFQTDTYSDKSYNGMSWVDGVIGLCASKNYPIPGCIGGQPIW